MIKNALLVARVSSDEQARSGASLESQKQWLNNIAIKEKLNVVKNIVDVVPGKIFPIKHYDEIIKCAQEKGIDYIVVHNFDRFARNFPYGSMLIQKLHEIRKIKIFTSLGCYNYDDSHDRFLVGFFLALAEQEQGARLERVVRGMFTKLKRGEWPLAPPFGFDVDKNRRLHPKDWCKEVINDIYDTFICVKNYSKTARIINEKHRKKFNDELTGQKVEKIVQDKTYLGYLRWGGEIFGDNEN